METTSIVIYIIVCLILYVITSLAMAKMFTKAGEDGWKGWVPIYNSYMVYKLTWTKNMFWISIILGIVLGIVSSAAAVYASVPLTVIQVIIYVITIVIGIIAMNKISKSYGHGIGFTIGLIFIPFIFYLIIAFGNSEYKGANL